MAGWKFLTCCNRLHTYCGPPAPLISTHPIHRIACILWVRQYFTLWPSMLFGKAVDTCQKIHRFFAVCVCRDCFLLGERKSRKSVQVFFSHKTAPGKMKIFLRSHEEVDGEEMIFLFQFGRILRWCLAAYESLRYLVIISIQNANHTQISEEDPNQKSNPFSLFFLWIISSSCHRCLTF